MKIILFTLFLSLIFSSCNSNKAESSDKDLKIFSPPRINPDNYDVIGFACGEGGEESPMVDEITKLIKDENYKELKANLYSSKPGMVYLATFSCEELEKEGLIKLTKTDRKQMIQNRTKTDKIYYCSGCTGSELYTVNHILTDSAHNLAKDAGYWINGLLGKDVIYDDAINITILPPVNDSI